MALAPLPAYPQRAPSPRPSRPVLPLPRRRRASLVPGLVVLGFCWLGVVAGAVLLVHRQAQIARIGYAIQDLKQQIRAVELENQSLTRQVAELKSLERIEAIAVQKLGMVKPQQVRIAAVVRPVLPQGGPLAQVEPEQARGATAERADKGMVAWLRAVAQQVLDEGRRLLTLAGGIRLGGARAEAGAR